MAIVQENRYDAPHPEIEETDYGAQYVKAATETPIEEPIVIDEPETPVDGVGDAAPSEEPVETESETESTVEETTEDAEPAAEPEPEPEPVKEKKRGRPKKTDNKK